VRLAIALLKDSSGKIVLDVPVQGSLDDPKFRVGKVVMRVIVNILEKVATSPFSLLGAVFGGGGDELSYQDFAPGSTDLSPGDLKKLDSLSKALAARPALELEISGSVNPASDVVGLQQAALDRDIRSRIWQQLRTDTGTTNSADQIVVSPADHAAWIQKLFQAALADGRISPAAIAANTNLAVLVATQAAASRTPEDIGKTGAAMQDRVPATQPPASPLPAEAAGTPPPADTAMDALLSLYPVNQPDLATLAAARAKAVQDYLNQTGKVAATRLFLTAQAATLNTNGTRAYLKFR